MTRRPLAAALLVIVIAGCSRGPGTSTATTIPPTTRVPAPVTPVGAADAPRRWTTLLADKSLDAVDLLGPGSLAAIGGRAGYPAVRAELERTWGRWSGVQATFDALPLGDRSAVVVIHLAQKDGSERAAAVPVVSDGTQWLVEPLLGVGDYTVVPADRKQIAPLPELSVEVATGVSVQAWVDEQPARVGKGTSSGGKQRYAYQPPIVLQPGWHLVTFVFTAGADVATGTVRYEVPEPK
ncbi:MAG: hypothetical protein JWM05_3384 [Acidimicrobiales bacterium]|nr:hypothetical protein [Acidimicrobiales bacterium]